MSEPVSASHQEWTKLERWLEEKHPGYQSNLSLRDVPGLERGLVAHASKSGDTLLHIPASAMLNPLTLIHNTTIPLHLFPQSSSRPRRTTTTTVSARAVSSGNNDEEDKSFTSEAKRRKSNNSPSLKKLDTTQLLTLHLALTRDPHGRHKSPWEGYIGTLPHEFRPWHPLTWLIAPTPSQNASVSKSASLLTPPSTVGTYSTSSPGHTSTSASSKKKSKSANTHPEHENSDGKFEHYNNSRDEWTWWSQLAEVGLSPSTRRKVEDVKKRFEEDYAALSEVLKEVEPFKNQRLAQLLTQGDFIWAWLNVNTRSISIPLGLGEPSERMNHTLVPIMDFINHSSDPKIITPRVRQLPTASRARRFNGGSSSSSTGTANANASANAHSLRKADKHLIPGKIDFRLVCPERGLAEEEEVFFEYGGHPSSTLFAEYGFCEVPKDENEDVRRWLGMRYGEVDVSWLVDELWSSLDEDEAAGKKEVLEAIGCWGGNTLHAQPSPAHPSHSLLMTLRVLHTPRSSPKLPNIARGLISYVSPQVEDRTLETLEGICKRTVRDAKKRVEKIAKLSSYNSLGAISSGGQMKNEEAKDEEAALIATKQGVLGMLSAMCEEEIVIATRVLERIQKGEEM
ncbi:hypothetical protein I316_06233 [Kwoniella heveanensis BCC8398]|uniref:SET domain-containing protein n=1 Tax=Kwoniella heveanensis BCC8398 TaxID=1296120 RepID=A0A1B9GM08_9TREE|nr:hypothetical protein I316_06233 [Kwoniella heveanensis BCC8398]